MLRSDTDSLPHIQELNSEPQMVSDEKLSSGGEISRKDCVEYVNSLLNFNSHVYQEFVYLMKDFKPESDDCIRTLKQKVKDLFKGYPDLMLGFNAFLPDRHKIPIPVEVQTSRKLPIVLSRKRKSYNDVCGAESNESKLQKAIDFMNKVKHRFGHDNEEGVDAFQSFLDVLFSKHSKRTKLSPSRFKSSHNKSNAYEIELQNYKKAVNVFESISKHSKRTKLSANTFKWSYNKSNADEDELQFFKKAIVYFYGHPDLYEELTQFVPTVSLPRLSKLIILANCETCTPSYSVLPENFPHPASTERTELASQVLNDRCVCVRSEGKGRNEELKKIFQWEGKKFEIDCAMNNVKSTSKSIRALMEKIETSNPSQIYIEDYLTQPNLNCIRYCYDAQGLKAMDELRKDVRGALPLLLTRLKQLEKELEEITKQSPPRFIDAARFCSYHDNCASRRVL